MQLNNYNDDHNDNKWIYVEKHTTKHSKKHHQHRLLFLSFICNRLRWYDALLW